VLAPVLPGLHAPVMRYGPAEQLVGLLLELGSARSGLAICRHHGPVSRQPTHGGAAAGHLQRLLFLEKVEPWEDRQKRWRLGHLGQRSGGSSAEETTATDSGDASGVSWSAITPWPPNAHATLSSLHGFHLAAAASVDYLLSSSQMCNRLLYQVPFLGSHKVLRMIRTRDGEAERR
jgi:hypothetical protein